MAYRIYVDESGTHESKWFILGMLFVPNHGDLHRKLLASKEQKKYLNRSKTKQRYKELHFKNFRNNKDVILAKEWIDLFLESSAFYRSLVVDWDFFQGQYFGDPFEPLALKKRRAYKKWAELLLQPEFSHPIDGQRIRRAALYLDRLLVMQGYDVIPELEWRFKENYQGTEPFIEKFQHTDSSKDSNQCLQLCDLLTGCIYQELAPSTKSVKREVRDYLKQSLQNQYSIYELGPKFWRGFDPKTLRSRFRKYSVWYWKPSAKNRKKK